MCMSNSIGEISKAIAMAQAEVANASKSSSNPHFKSRYADLAEIINMVRPVYSRHHIAIVQMPAYKDGMVMVTTTLMHSSGEFISSTLSAPVSKPDAQGIGSATTYCRRYSLAAMCGIAQEDDDGEGAVGRGNGSKPAPPPKQLDENIVGGFEIAQTMEELASVWNRIPVGVRRDYAGVKDEAKARIGGGNAPS